MSWQKGLTARQVLRVTKAVGADPRVRELSRAEYLAALAAKRSELYPTKAAQA